MLRDFQPLDAFFRPLHVQPLEGRIRTPTGQSSHGENTLGSGTGVCEIKAVLTNLIMSRRPPSPLFQCLRESCGEWKVVRTQSRVLREGSAEQGNIEIGETGCLTHNLRGQFVGDGFYFANTGNKYGAPYRDIRKWRSQKHR